MPDFIVTQDMVDYVKFQKKQAREKAANVMLALFVFIMGIGSVCYLAGFFG